MGSIDKSNTKRTWVRPELSDLDVGQTLTGPFTFAVETFDLNNLPVGGPPSS
jgi:hypothetical protein